MMHLAREAGQAFPIFTLDTGLLFPETLELKKRLEDFFGWRIESVVPDLTLEQQAEAQGPDLWNRDPDLCCTMRKVLPLQSSLRDLDCWITGLRRTRVRQPRRHRDHRALHPGPAGRRRHCQTESHGRLDARGGVGLHRPSITFPTIPCTTSGYQLHRLHDMHGQNRQRRERAGRALDRLQEGRMRHPHLHVAKS